MVLTRSVLEIITLFTDVWSNYTEKDIRLKYITFDLRNRVRQCEINEEHLNTFYFSKLLQYIQTFLCRHSCLPLLNKARDWNFVHKLGYTSFCQDRHNVTCLHSLMHRTVHIFALYAIMCCRHLLARGGFKTKVTRLHKSYECCFS